jgi:hypothetical protein
MSTAVKPTTEDSVPARMRALAAPGHLTRRMPPEIRPQAEGGID